ncbi:hypothetical protein EV363DRAFT_1490568 [Boletus edulis]|nr:hypothetical protein EV363DRAFT_1490568 [Boletus edulis]
MFSRSLLARSSPLRPLTTRVCSRPLSIWRLQHAARYAVPSCANLRQFSAAPAFRTENGDDKRVSFTPSGTCYIANIPYEVTAEQLKDAFADLGKVMSVRLLTSGEGRSRGIGFVQFESVEDAVNFVEMHAADPIFVLDRKIFVEHAQKTGNVRRRVEPSDTLMVPESQGTSEAEVQSMFGSYADDILAVRFDKKEPWRNAFIQFRDVEVATEAMEAFRNQNEDIQIRYARQRQPPANMHSLTSRLSQFRAQ